MNQTDFLIAHPETRGGKSRPFVIGESGFSFGNRERPATTRDTWLNSDGIPAAARDVLTRHPQFTDIVGLVGVPGRTLAARRPSATWVLARASSGLVSIAVRDARDCDPACLAEDATLAIAAAERFGAQSIVVLVQGTTISGAEAARAALQSTFKTDMAETNRLYRSQHADSPIWLASLSPTD
ncbi:hypothetical protein GCM10027093_46520 [Paraburkholderia jirisanensis]